MEETRKRAPKRAEIEESDPTDEELAELDAEKPAAQHYPGDVAREVDTSVPPWVKLPADLPFPPHGVTWAAMRFLAEWTDRPHLGDRQCIVWNLSYGDEKFARRRSKGEAESTLDEMAKQMVRAIDGKRVDWANPSSPNNPDLFWDQIGKKCRLILVNHYTKVHVLDRDEQMHFFGHCLAVRTAAPSSTGPAGRKRGR